MGRKCIVPFCHSGYDSCGEKVSMFSVPRNRLEDWQKAIGRTDLSLTPRHTVCEKHFRKKDIIREIKTEIYTYPLLIPKLSENAIPRIFPKKYQFRPRGKDNASLISLMKVNSAAIRNMKRRFSTMQQLEVTSRDEFMEKLKENRQNSNNMGSLSKETYDKIIAEISQNSKKIKLNKKTMSRKRLKKLYDIIKVEGNKRLIFPSTTGNDRQVYVHDDELFDVLQNAHISLNHGGAHKMVAELKQTYKNISYKDITTYISLCPRCSNKKSRKRKIVQEEKSKPKQYHTELSSSCHLHILDYQTSPDDEFKYILIYQNDLTKYHLLRPLKSRTAENIYVELNDISAFLGVPTTIYSNLENALMKDVIKKMNIWPHAQITHVKYEDDDNIDYHENVNEHLVNWMEHNNTNKWSEGLRFVQFIINQDYHNDINGAPYDALFKLSTDDMTENTDKVNKFSGNMIKEESVEIFSCVCDGCGNDIGNDQSCTICQNQLLTIKNEVSKTVVDIKKEDSI